jgi:hypothetical protein
MLGSPLGGTERSDYGREHAIQMLQKFGFPMPSLACRRHRRRGSFGLRI